MFLSIIIPVYNAEKYLSECLESCYNQDLPLDDYEIICINDGSKDNSLQILKQFATKYPNLIVIDQKNSGVSVARNRGIAQVRADYIWFVDSDDSIKPNCLRLLKDASAEHCDIINFSGYSYTESMSQQEWDQLSANKLSGNMSYWGFVAVHLYKSEIIKSNQIFFDTQIAYGEDELFYINVLERSEKVKAMDDVLYLYRGHAESAMNQLWSPESKLKRLDSVIRAMIVLKDGLDSGRYVHEEAKYLLARRYELCPYLIASLDRKRIKQYMAVMCNNNLFERDFVRKYDLPKKWKFTLFYQKERYYDKLIAAVKSLMPKSAVEYIKSLRK